MIRSLLKILIVAGAASGLAGAAHAAGGEVKEYKRQQWHFSGPFGTYDQDALQRGYQVYEAVCASCHGLKQLAFRNLGQKGGPFYLDRCPPGVPATINCSNPNENPIVRAAAAQYRFQITDGPDETGDMFERAALPSDAFPDPYANEQLARLANAGALPPDLSLMVKARAHGADYIYSLLTGYEAAPETVTIAPGQYYNPYFAGDMAQLIKPEYLDEAGHPRAGVEIPKGGVLAMAPPLADGMIDYADPTTPQTVEQYAKDVVEFLAWASEPKMEERKRLGIITLAYLLVLAGILYWSYRKIWAKVPH